METILNKELFENVLLTSWNSFLDIRKLKNIVQKVLDENNYNTKHYPNSISLSRFEWNSKGFILWVEFKSNLIEGTIEILLNPNSYEIINFLINDIQSSNNIS